MSAGASDLRVGATFAGYVIEGIAGRGGMGVVYRASQERPRRVVALKVIAGDLAASPAFRTRFERESDMAASIEHPNVLPVYEVGEEDGLLFIAMRFVDGVDLGSVLSREGRLEPGRAVRLAAQVAGALDAAHARGLVHRDIKPANVLIAGAPGAEHAYLTDFGVGKRIESTTGITETGEFVGTLDYIAPEQVERGRVDARSDVYSLGCLLYQAVTGTVPFPRDSHAAKLFAHVREPPPRASEVAPSIAPQLDGVLARAMAKRPDDRYLSAGDFARAATAAVQGGTVTRAERNVGEGEAAPLTASSVAPSSEAGGPLKRIARSGPRAARRRRRVWLAAAAVAVVAAAAAAGLLLGRGDGREDAPSEEEVRALLESYSARYTAADLGGLGALLAPDLKRYVAGNEPQTRDEAIGNIQQQLDQVREPRYTFEGGPEIESSGDRAVVRARYRIVDRASPREVLGVVASGRLSFRVRTDGDRLLIDEIRLVPDLLLRYTVAEGAAPARVEATATIPAVQARPAAAGPAQSEEDRAVIGQRPFRIRRAGTHLLVLPLNGTGARSLRWGTPVTIDYRQRSRGGAVATDRDEAVFEELGFVFQQP